MTFVHVKSFFIINKYSIMVLETAFKERYKVINEENGNECREIAMIGWEKCGH